MLNLRIFFSFLSAFLLLTCLFYLSLSATIDDYGDTEDAHTSKSPFGALFSFRNPASLFIASATITLTDDNSTYFVARPAAFGPLLPHKGLSGEIWIGRGFGDASVQRRGLYQNHEGELGCGDVPGRDGRRGEPDFDIRKDVEEDAITPPYAEDGSKHMYSRRDAAPADQVDAYEQFLQESNDIQGKVALLSRGGCGFVEKIRWAQRRGATAVIVGDNLFGGPLVRMYARGDTSNITIPSIFTSHTTAHLLSSLVPTIMTMPSSDSTTNELLGDHDGKIDADAPEAKEQEPSGSERTDDDTMNKSNGENPSESEASANHGGYLAELFSLLGYRLDKYDAGFSKNSPSAGYLIWKKLTKFDEDEREQEPQSKPRVPGESDAMLASSIERIKSSIELSHSHGNESRDGLWVTLTPSNINTSPFFNTLFVLVVSPLVTLAIVYSMLLLRSRIRRRRWRAPKSVIERLPVRIYQALSRAGSGSSSPRLHPQGEPNTTTPLLGGSQPVNVTPRAPAHLMSTSAGSSPSCHRYGSLEPSSSTHEKIHSGLSEWRKKFGDKQIECVVCLEEYVDGISKVMSLPCGHEFHADCITPWLTTRRRTCPICKGDVVRSLRRQPLPGEAANSPHSFPRQPADAADENIQIQAAESTNDSLAASTPIPREQLVHHVGVGRGRVERESSPEATSLSERWPRSSIEEENDLRRHGAEA